MFYLLIRCHWGSAALHRRRQRTQYVDDDHNWVYMCEPCLIENAEYWDEMWADYYRSQL